MAVGRILRFDDARGYGFIAPSAGGEDVFVHANDFGEQRHLVRAGLPVEYEIEEGDRGLKVATVRIIERAGSGRVGGPVDAASGRARTDSGDDDDGMCDVLSPRQFTGEVTEALIQHVPSLTGTQIAQVRESLLGYARSHGWVEG